MIFKATKEICDYFNEEELLCVVQESNDGM